MVPISGAHKKLPEVDVNEATVLYNLIQQNRSKEAAERAFTNPEETYTYVVKKDESNGVKWKVLPIHHAVMTEGNYDLINALILSFPDGLKYPDESGMLPLHHIFLQPSNSSVLNLLVKAFPEALHVKNNDNRTPIELMDPDVLEDVGEENPLLPYVFEKMEELNEKVKKTEETKNQIVSVNRSRQNMWESEKKFLKEQLSRSLEENDHVLSTFRESREKHDEEIGKLKIKQKELKQENLEKKKRLDEVVAAMTVLNETVKAQEKVKTKKMQSMTSKLDTQKKEIKKFQDFFQKIKCEVETKDADVINLKQEVKDLTAKTDTLTRQLEMEKETSNANLLALKQEKKSTVVEMQKIIHGKDDDISERDSDIMKLKSEVEKMQEAITKKENNVKNLESQIKTMKDTVSEKESEIVSLKRQVETNQNTIDETNNGMNDLISRVKTMEVTICQRDATINDLKCQAESMQISISKRDADVNNLESQLDTYKKTIYERDEDLTNLQSKIEMMQKTISENDTSMVRLKKERSDVAMAAKSLRRAMVNTLKLKKNLEKAKGVSEESATWNGAEAEEGSRDVTDFESDTALLEKLKMDGDHPFRVMVQETISRRDEAWKELSFQTEVEGDEKGSTDDSETTEIITMLEKARMEMDFMSARLDVLSAVNSWCGEAVAERDTRLETMETSLTEETTLTKEQKATIECLETTRTALESRSSEIQKQLEDREHTLTILRDDLKVVSKKNSEFATEVTEWKRRNVETRVQWEKERDRMVADYESRLIDRARDVVEEWEKERTQWEEARESLQESWNEKWRDAEMRTEALANELERLREVRASDEKERQQLRKDRDEKDDRIEECRTVIQSLNNQVEEYVVKLKTLHKIYEVEKNEMSTMNDLLRNQMNQLTEEYNALERQITRTKENSGKQRDLLAKERAKNLMLEAKCVAADRNFDVLKEEIEAMRRDV